MHPAIKHWFTLTLIVACLSITARAGHCAGGSAAEKPTFEQFLRASAVTPATIEVFLRGPSWAQFDPELGYILGKYMPTDGVDHSATISTVQPDGARTSYMYANKKCRINTYGDSFTQCHQVSDGETWQEYLAAHLGEPVRNFGMGGYGVYQAYRRLLREEKTDHAAEYLIFYIWGDDSMRSLLRCRRALTYPGWDDKVGQMFHGNFWPNIEMDLETGHFVEHENLLPTPASLMHMTEPQWIADHLKDDLALELAAYRQGSIRELDRKPIDRLAAHLNFTFDWNQTSTLRDQAGKVLDKYSLAATRYILDKLRAYAEREHKKLLIVLFDPYRVMSALRKNEPRYDQEIVDYLAKEKMTSFDMNIVQLRDFENYKLSYQDYMKQYFVGHYNPRGNHFFAYSIKDVVVPWLDPKPITYQKVDPKTIDFKTYLRQQ